MSKREIYPDWAALRRATHSPFFSGGKADIVHDQSRKLGLALNEEALFTQSNARVLLGHGANGMLRFIAMPTQVYAAPTGSRELGLGVGMYHHFDVVMYAGNLCYRLELDGHDNPLIISSAEDPAAGMDVKTVYADDFLPRTTGEVEGLEVMLATVAPVAPDNQPGTRSPLAPAPLPGPAGAVYALHLRNTGDSPLRGKVVLQASDLLVGHYEDARPGRGGVAAPDMRVRQNTLILTQPFGAAGVHLHDGVWRSLEAPYEAEIGFSLAPGAAQVFETHVAVGADFAAIMPTIYALHLRPALDWMALTASFWRERLGALCVDVHGAAEDARVSRDIYVRSLFDNFNCLQTDAEGTLLAHWQGAPSHGYGTVWGIDVEPTAVSVAHLCPEIAWATLRFFMHRSRVPRGTSDHSLPILVAPIVIARQWLQITGDVEQLRSNPDVMDALRSIVDDLLALKAPAEDLFPSRYSSDGGVGRRYDYGTNVKVWYAFDSMAYMARALGEDDIAASYGEMAAGIRAAIARTMTADGPFGPQIHGGTNLGEDPGSFYLEEGVPYYDGEDTSSMLAPIYGLTGFTDETWVNYHRWARSIWCPNFDPEFGALRWSPRGFAGGALDGTGYFSRLGGSVTPAEMLEALRTIWHIGTDPVTGSVFWWPHGLEYRRALTRCSQGQGAWAWQYLKQWLGLEVDALSRTLTVAPRGLLTTAAWQGFRAGPHAFDVEWHEEGSSGADSEATATSYVEITNRNAETWTVQVGFRQRGAGATGGLAWQSLSVAPGATVSLASPGFPAAAPQSMDESHMVLLEVEAEGEEGVLFRRFGPEQLWGHWEVEKLWVPPAMPLVLRLLVVNGTETGWDEVSVRVSCPEGWLAEGREPRHWTRPVNWVSEPEIVLTSIPGRSRAVVPFWVQWPDGLDLQFNWHEGAEVPFHTTTQPGPGLTLHADNLEDPLALSFEAEMTIRTAGGDVIRRTLSVPVAILPVVRSENSPRP
jgi:hypothetical protein